MTITYTPGPWKVVPEEKGGALIAHESENGTEYMALVFRGHEIGDFISNVSLISAAPETAAERDTLKEVNAVLLKALKDLKNAIENAPEDEGYVSAAIKADHYSETLDRAEAAIAKAEGK